VKPYAPEELGALIRADLRIAGGSGGVFKVGRLWDRLRRSRRFAERATDYPWMPKELRSLPGGDRYELPDVRRDAYDRTSIPRCLDPGSTLGCIHSRRLPKLRNSQTAGNTGFRQRTGATLTVPARA